MCLRGNRLEGEIMNAATNFPGLRAGSAQIIMVAAVSIGIGGMVGAGIFSILGVGAQTAGHAMWLPLPVAGVGALLSTHSSSKPLPNLPSPRRARQFFVESLRHSV